MNLSTYKPSDLHMYLSGTFIRVDNTPCYINNVVALDEDNDIIEPDSDNDPQPSVIRFYMYRKDSDGATIEETIEHPYNYTLPMLSAPLGYREVDNHVVYFYHVQGNNYKKLPTFNSIRSFNPQTRELEFLSSRTLHLDNSTIRNTLLTPPTYYSLEEAYELLTSKTKHAVPLHKHYALVKKGKFAHPVIYYKTDPVILYDGTNLTPLISECHINKFHLEVTANANRS